MSPCDNPPDVAIADKAYAHLCDLILHDKLRYGDIKKTAITYGLSDEQYRNLRQRVLR